MRQRQVNYFVSVLSEILDSELKLFLETSMSYWRLSYYEIVNEGLRYFELQGKDVSLAVERSALKDHSLSPREALFI